MLFWNFQTYLTMSCHHTLFYFPVLELLHNTSKLPWLFACILLYIFSLLPHLLLICSIIKFLKYLWTENIISVTFISLMMTFYLLFQGCKCHEVASDETCLDCLRSKCNIGRYVKNLVRGHVIFISSCWEFSHLSTTINDGMMKLVIVQQIEIKCTVRFVFLNVTNEPTSFPRIFGQTKKVVDMHALILSGMEWS